MATVDSLLFACSTEELQEYLDDAGLAVVALDGLAAVINEGVVASAIEHVSTASRRRMAMRQRFQARGC